jgi:hypothetical protein
MQCNSEETELFFAQGYTYNLNSIHIRARFKILDGSLVKYTPNNSIDVRLGEWGGQLLLVSCSDSNNVHLTILGSLLKKKRSSILLNQRTYLPLHYFKLI